MTLTLRSTDGLALEAELDGPLPPTKVLVLCHPHPQMGGTMRAPLLQVLRDDLVGRGWSVLRFNFRGIGSSEGRPGTGTAEIADAEGALAYVAERFPGLPVAIAGWSFGAAVALRTAALHPELIGCVGIAPAIVSKPGITAGLPPPAQLGLKVPALLIAAAKDKLSLPADCQAWAEEAGASYVEIPGANHFFWARYEQLASAVAAFLDDHTTS